MRVFLDTNVLVSAFAARGLSADLLELITIEHDLVTGQAVLTELERALRIKLKLPGVRCAEVIEFLASETALIVEKAALADCGVDKGDRLVLGEAIAAQAEVFITGDRELLSLGAVGPVRILTPRPLWDLLRQRARR